LEHLSQVQPGSLGSNTVSSIYIDKYDKIYFGTGNGIYCFNSEEESFVPLDLNLPGRNVSCIIGYEDELWITTSRGLVHYNSGGESTTFTTKDGLRSEHFLPNSGLLASDGKIYIGSVNGFNAFYPYKIQKNYGSVVSRVEVTIVNIDQLVSQYHTNEAELQGKYVEFFVCSP
jgi:ligand-binding sensor domain-containing protein